MHDTGHAGKKERAQEEKGLAFHLYWLGKKRKKKSVPPFSRKNEKKKEEKEKKKK